MPRGNVKREVDLQTMMQWIAPNLKVLDIGCGRGVFLELLKEKRGAYGLGVDRDPRKIAGCIKRGLNAYQGNAEDALGVFNENSFDWVICSRMLHELEHPYKVISQALRVGHHVAVGFINFGFWETRLSILMSGQRPKNEVYPDMWHFSRPTNPLTIKDFERFCEQENIHVTHRVYLNATWRSPIKVCPNLMAGYAVYAITRDP